LQAQHQQLLFQEGDTNGNSSDSNPQKVKNDVEVAAKHNEDLNANSSNSLNNQNTVSNVDNVDKTNVNDGSNIPSGTSTRFINLLNHRIKYQVAN
jgi:hypothetical protein